MINLDSAVKPRRCACDDGISSIGIVLRFFEVELVTFVHLARWKHQSSLNKQSETSCSSVAFAPHLGLLY